jgi:hypothetical protein
MLLIRVRSSHRFNLSAAVFRRSHSFATLSAFGRWLTFQPQLTRLPLKGVAPFLLFIMTATASFATTANWEKTIWQGEAAWISTQDNVRAVVTEARSRLIYLGSSDGAFNLLNAPTPLPDAGQNQGGHRFWLGPQCRWKWPPLKEWEFTPARLVCGRDGMLVLSQPQTNLAYPALTREYAWEGKRLRCTVRWQDNGQAYFGLHIVAINTPVAITVRLEKTKDAPAGLVAARMVDPEPPLHLPHPSITLDGDNATVRSDIKKVKLGFVSQPLTVNRQHGWKLSVMPGPCSTPTSDAPDHGYLSQIWVGDKTNDLAELEQLTPSLKGDASGTCTSTIYIEAIPPAR